MAYTSLMVICRPKFTAKTVNRTGLEKTLSQSLVISAQDSRSFTVSFIKDLLIMASRPQGTVELRFGALNLETVFLIHVTGYR